MLNLSSLPELLYEGKPALAPIEKDLQRLYDCITITGPSIILEYGCGYSTFVIAQALEEIKAPGKMCACFSLDANQNWLKEVAKKLNNPIANFMYSPCHVTLYEGQLCHCFDRQWNIVPQFIYLDAPHTNQVRGNIMNLSWEGTNRHPLGADILFYESTLFPKTKVLVDGRTNNARFLARNFKRHWLIEHDAREDYTLMILDEPPFITPEVYREHQERWALQENRK